MPTPMGALNVILSWKNRKRCVEKGNVHDDLICCDPLCERRHAHFSTDRTQRERPLQEHIPPPNNRTYQSVSTRMQIRRQLDAPMVVPNAKNLSVRMGSYLGLGGSNSGLWGGLSLELNCIHCFTVQPSYPEQTYHNLSALRDNISQCAERPVCHGKGRTRSNRVHTRVTISVHMSIWITRTVW